ncbi:MAG TPA: hypothetical protein VIY47_11110 [Ignavibacteriaceae bacterium]
MFSKKFRFSTDGEEYPSYLPLWVSLIQQEYSGRFSEVVGSDISDVYFDVLNAYASSIYFVALNSFNPSKDLSKAMISFYSEGKDAHEEDERTQYASCFEMYRDIVLRDSKQYLLSGDYPVLQKAKLLNGVYLGSVSFGDLKEKISFNQRKFFLATMYLITSSWENGKPDFEFSEVPENIRPYYQEWVKNKNHYPKIEELCQKFPETMSINSEKIYKELRNLMFEEFCYQKLIDGTDVSRDQLEQAEIAAKEMWNDPKQQFKSVLDFAIRKIGNGINRESNVLDLNGMAFHYDNFLNLP